MTRHHTSSWGSQEATTHLILNIISLFFPYPGCVTETASAGASCKQNYLPGNLSERENHLLGPEPSNRIEPSKVIGHVFREIDVLFPDIVIIYVSQHIKNKFLFRWKTRAVIVKAETICFIYSSYKCYHQRETMERMFGLHIPQGAQHVLSHSQSLFPWGVHESVSVSQWLVLYFNISLHYLYQVI